MRGANDDAERNSSRIPLMEAMFEGQTVSLKCLSHHEGMSSGRATGSNMWIVKRMEWDLEGGEGWPSREAQRVDGMRIGSPRKLYAGEAPMGDARAGGLQTRGNSPCLPAGSEDGDGETPKGGPLWKMTGMEISRVSRVLVFTPSELSPVQSPSSPAPRDSALQSKQPRGSSDLLGILPT